VASRTGLVDWGIEVARGWLLACLVLGIVAGIAFAAYPNIDVEVARLFYDGDQAKFPVSNTYEWNLIRQLANWIPFLLLVPAIFALLRKITFPETKMIVAPSVAVFLVGSCIVGPGLTSNLLLKESWGRPRPIQVQQFAGAADFKPWWKPGGACERNCSFVSGEASQAFWVVAPAALAPPQVRPIALGTAVVFGTSVGAMRIIFGRHFLSDVVFAGLITIAIVMAFYLLLMQPIRRNDARVERIIERGAIALHRNIGALLSQAGTVLARTGSTLRQTGQNLHKRTACL